MESLSETIWDVVLLGTGLSQSLLALALSHSDKKVLHLDKNDYYGGAEAALSLEEAETWTKSVEDNSITDPFRRATIQHLPQDDRTQGKLGFSRAYSLALSPQLIYTRSNLLPSLVSSKVYRQLEFLAIGSWWIYDHEHHGNEQPESKPNLGIPDGRLMKIPGGREDIFADESIDLRSSRSLMRFLRLAADPEAQSSTLEEWGSTPFPECLSSHFKIPQRLQAPLLALAMSPDAALKTTTAYALRRIHRHLTSIGMFGPGFGAVTPKWGGLAEIAQVGCRAGAVGGGVYVLGKGIKNKEKLPYQADSSTLSDGGVITSLQLDDGETIKTKKLVGSSCDFASENEQQTYIAGTICRTISIVSSPMSRLFLVPAEGAPPPAGAVVVFPSGTLTLKTEPQSADHPPVYLIIHSSDTGECPAGQCIIYAQTTPSPSSTHDGSSLLILAVTKLLATLNEDPSPQVLWRMSYTHSIPHSAPASTNPNNEILTIPEIPPSFIIEDDVLHNVRAAWERIVGDEKGDGFMMFSDRGEGEGDDEVYEAL